MLINIGIAALMMVATTGINAGGMFLAVRAMQSHRESLRQGL